MSQNCESSRGKNIGHVEPGDEFSVTTDQGVHGLWYGRSSEVTGLLIAERDENKVNAAIINAVAEVMSVVERPYRAVCIDEENRRFRIEAA